MLILQDLETKVMFSFGMAPTLLASLAVLSVSLTIKGTQSRVESAALP